LDTDIDQTLSFSFSQTIGSSNTFEHSTGFEVGASVEVECKLPLLGGSTVTLSSSFSQSWTYGGENHID